MRGGGSGGGSSGAGGGGSAGNGTGAGRKVGTAIAVKKKGGGVKASLGGALALELAADARNDAAQAADAVAAAEASQIV